MLFSIDLLWYLCVLIICSCWQYGCTPQLASDKQYRLQAQLAHVVSRIDILFYFVFLNTRDIYFVCTIELALCLFILIITLIVHELHISENILNVQSASFFLILTIDILHTKFIKWLLPNQIAMQ